MLASNIPANKFPVAWASSAGGGYVRTIPQASQIGIQDGAASLTDGFPPLNFLPVASGGVPPFGEDANGILKEISLWSQWQQAGGQVPYDGSFSTSIGGYPKWATLASTVTVGLFWMSMVDNNTTDPDGGGAANWVPYGPVGVQQRLSNFAVDTGAANAYLINLAPPILAYTRGLEISFLPANSCTGAGSTINVNGLGVKSIVRRDGSGLQSNDIVAGGICKIIYQNTLGKFVLMNQVVALSDVQNAAALPNVTVPDTGTPTTICNGIGGPNNPSNFNLIRVATDNGASISYAAMICLLQFATTVTPGATTVTTTGGAITASFSMSGANLQMAITSSGTFPVSISRLN